MARYRKQRDRTKIDPFAKMFASGFIGDETEIKESHEGVKASEAVKKFMRQQEERDKNASE